MVCSLLHCLAWIHNSGAPLHPYIPYYNRAVALTCAASGVALVYGMYWRCCDTLQRGAGGIIAVCVGLVFAAVEWGNSQKSPCKALCAALRCGWYNCIDDTKAAVNICMGLYCSRAKIKALHPQQMQGKRKARRAAGLIFYISLASIAAQFQCFSLGAV